MERSPTINKRTPMFIPESRVVRECISTDAAGAPTCRSLGHHLLHPQIVRLSVLLKPADFEAQNSLL